MTRIAILGGGVAGVVLAQELSPLSDCSIDLYEQQETLGGLHRSVEIDGTQYDIGAFLFDREHALLETFPFLYDHFIPLAQRSQVITSLHTLDIYPMTMKGYLASRSLPSLIADSASLLLSKLRDRKRSSLQEYVGYYLGPRIYRQSGLKKYIERFYGVPDDEVDLEFAIQRLDSLPEHCGLRRNFGKILRETFGTSTTGAPWHCYVRPKEGFSQAYGLIEEHLRASGVSVNLGARIEKIVRSGELFDLQLADGRTERYDLVVSTIPIGIMMKLIGEPMGRPPDSVELVTLFYRFSGDPGFTDTTLLYNFTEDALWKRITFHSQMYGQIDGEDFFSVECTHRPERNRTVEELRNDFEAHIATLPVLNGELRFQGATTTRNAYPFFGRDDLQRITDARERLSEFGIATTGRQGSFRYLTAHRTALASRELARQLRGDQQEEAVV